MDAILTETTGRHGDDAGPSRIVTWQHADRATYIVIFIRIGRLKVGILCIGPLGLCTLF